MAYNPQNMYRPGVLPDTQSMGPGIEAAGKAVSGAIEQYGNTRAAAQAADAEYDLFQQLYPDAAGMIDPEKFHSANLAGKQKMLGLGKGYVLERQKKAEFDREMTFKELESAQRTAIAGAQLELSAKELGLRATQHQDQMGISAQELGLRATEAADRKEMSAKELGFRTGLEASKLELSAQELGLKAADDAASREWRNRGPSYQRVGNSDYYTPMAPTGNQLTNMPNMKMVNGKMVPVPAAGAKPIILPANKPYFQYNPATGQMEPIQVGQGGAAADPFAPYLQ